MPLRHYQVVVRKSDFVVDVHKYGGLELRSCDADGHTSFVVLSYEYDLKKTNTSVLTEEKNTSTR